MMSPLNQSVACFGNISTPEYHVLADSALDKIHDALLKLEEELEEDIDIEYTV